MQPRLTIHASCAASRTTISCAVRPDGKRSSTVSIHSGRDSGRALLEEELALGPVHVALEGHRAARRPRAAPLGDRQVVPDEVELGVAGSREEHLVRVGDGDLAAGDLQDLLAGGHPPGRARRRPRAPRVPGASRDAVSSPIESPSTCTGNGSCAVDEDLGCVVRVVDVAPVHVARGAEHLPGDPRDAPTGELADGEHVQALLERGLRRHPQPDPFVVRVGSVRPTMTESARSGSPPSTLTARSGRLPA